MPQPLGAAVVVEDLGPRLAGRRHLQHLARQRPVGADAHLGGDDLVEQRAQALDGEVEGAGDEHRAVPERPVLAHPAQPGREALRQDDLGQQLLGVGLDLLDGGVLVAPVEVAQEVAAVDAVELQQARAPRPSCAARSATARRGRGGASPATSSSRRRCWRSACSRGRTRRGGAWGRAPGGAAARCGRCAVLPGTVLTRACWTIEGRWIVRMYVGQSTSRGSKANAARSRVVEPLPHRHQVVDLVHGLALGVQAVQLDVLERPLDLHPLGLQLGRQLGLLAPQRQRLEHLLAAGDRRPWPGSAGPAPGPGRGSGTRARRSAGPRCRRAGAR